MRPHCSRRQPTGETKHAWQLAKFLEAVPMPQAFRQRLTRQPAPALGSSLARLATSLAACSLPRALCRSRNRCRSSTSSSGSRSVTAAPGLWELRHLGSNSQCVHQLGLAYPSEACCTNFNHATLQSGMAGRAFWRDWGGCQRL